MYSASGDLERMMVAVRAPDRLGPGEDWTQAYTINLLAACVGADNAVKSLPLLTEAVERTRLLPPRDRQKAILSLIEAELRIGQIDAALSLARALPEGGPVPQQEALERWIAEGRRRLQVDLVPALLEMGWIGAARALAQDPLEVSPIRTADEERLQKALALGHVARALLSAHRVTEAVEVAGQAASLIPENLDTPSSNDQAREEFESQRWPVIFEVAQVQAMAGAPESARATVGRLWRADFLSGLAGLIDQLRSAGHAHLAEPLSKELHLFLAPLMGRIESDRSADLAAEEKRVSGSFLSFLPVAPRNDKEREIQKKAIRVRAELQAKRAEYRAAIQNYSDWVSELEARVHGWDGDIANAVGWARRIADDGQMMRAQEGILDALVIRGRLADAISYIDGFVEPERRIALLEMLRNAVRTRQRNTRG